MRSPLGIKVLAILFAFVSLGGLVSFCLFLNDKNIEPSKVHGWTNLAYVILALVSSLGLFEFKSWAKVSVSIFASAVAFREVFLQIHLKFGKISGSDVAHFIFIAIIMGLMVHYVFRTLPGGKH